MVANVGMLTLNRDEVIQYVGANAQNYGLDPAAVLAVANHEGLNRPPISGVGQTWILPNEGGFSNFGPPSWFAGGAGADIVKQQGSLQTAATWAWTPAGLDYWMQKVAEGKPSASGRTGFDAIWAIVNGFEHPREDLAPGEVNNAWHDYQSFQQQILGLPGSTIPIPIPGFPKIPGQTGPGQLPTPTDPQQKPSTQTTPGPKFSMHILDLPTGPINLTLPWDFSGILLFLAALLAIIIGALLWDRSRTVIVNAGAMAV